MQVIVVRRKCSRPYPEASASVLNRRPRLYFLRHFLHFLHYLF